MPPSSRTSNAINMNDYWDLTTSSTGDVTITFDQPCTKQVPDRIYAHAVLAADYSDPTPPGISLPAGTVLRVSSILSKTMSACTIRFMLPGGETLRNPARIHLTFAAFEFAK